MNLQGRDLKPDLTGDDVRLLHSELAQLGLPIPDNERQTGVFGGGTQEVVRRFQAAHKLPPNGVVDATTAAAINQAVSGPLPTPAPAGDGGVANRYTVSGHVFSAVSAGVGGLTAQVVDKNAGPDVPLGEATTDANGHYATQLDASPLAANGKAAPDIQVRILQNGTLLGASEVRYNASTTETIDVFLPPAAATSLPSEYETLTAAIAGHYTGALRDLQETDAQQDITYLANKTGWDARAVALAALADQSSAQTMDPAGSPSIPAAAFYALFRAGLPTDASILYHTDPATLGPVLMDAATQGLVPRETINDLPGLVQHFQALSARTMLAAPAMAGTSSLSDLLSTSGLDATQQQTFAGLFAANRSDMTAFWQGVSNTLGDAVGTRLQVDGKLAFLTINNAPLVQAVHAQVGGAGGITDPLQLAQAGYHRPEAWAPLLSGDNPIPPEIPGDGPDAKRANYAQYLAAQVRLSYPTASIAEMVQSGAILTKVAGLRDQVQAFLSEHQGQFDIGSEPIERYVSKNSLDAPAETVAEISRLQRVYQITPNDQAMATLLESGIESAYQLARYRKGDFIQAFADRLGGSDQAGLIHDRAVQVHGAVLNVAVSYLLAKNAPGIGVHSPAHILDPAPQPANTGDVIAYDTLESLFGSMDFCTCDHCRSVLSPAAYLVDLLDFLHLDNPTKEDPQAVLLDRRPDIEHLPLTCENTNTALPYIDVVNETLEYYIANATQPLSLQGYTGHDTDAVATLDLIATPQFVLDPAYKTLAGERFPAPLPFHKPLEELRRQFARFGVSLPQAMERLRAGDDVQRGANPYGWQDILMEELRVSRPEFEILTDSNAVPLWALCGLPTGTSDGDAITALSNAEGYAKRLGITYEDLASLLETRFVNPDGDLIPKLVRLGVPFSMLAALKTNNDAKTDAVFDAILAGLAVPPDPVEYGGDIKAWVKDNANYARVMGLVTLAIPAATWAPAAAHDVGDPVRPTNSDPGSSLYFECVQAGASGPSEPAWPTESGGTVDDGTVRWTAVDTGAGQSFGALAFRYSDPSKLLDPVGPEVFIRAARFIRLWRKLGWSIEDTDAAVCALFRADLGALTAGDLDSAAKLDAGFTTLLPRLGVLTRVMDRLNLVPRRDLRSLLACWADIDTHGATALYRQLFLGPALLQKDPVFADNGYGIFPVASGQKLAEHAEGLRAAFNLTGDEYSLIAAALGYDANTPLDLAAMTAVFRRGWLARKLRLSVREFLLFTNLSGIDPFGAPDPAAAPILRLIELVQALRNRSIKSAVALYLIWNQDLSGSSAPDPLQVMSLARDLRGDFASIEDQLAAAQDPSGDPARARMVLVYGQDASDGFFDLLDGTVVVDVAYTHATPTLESAIVLIDPNVAYDDFRHRLSHTGLLTDAGRTALKAVVGVSAGFQQAVDELHDRGQQIEGLFFNRYPDLLAPYQAASGEAPGARHAAFLALFEPALSSKRKRQQALQRLSATVGVDLGFAQALLAPGAPPFALHADGDSSRPALDDVVALETPGLSVQFFYRDTATGSPDLAVVDGDLVYVPGGAHSLPPNPTPGAAISGTWTGRIEAAEAGFHNLIVETDADATVSLSLDGRAVTLVRNGALWRNGDPIELDVGTLHDVELTVEKVKDAMNLEWETPKRPREVIPPRYLYPPGIFQPFSDAYLRFLKAASLASALKLTSAEIARAATQSQYEISGDGWLNSIPVSGNPSAALAHALVSPLGAVLDYARLKAALAPDDERLLKILDDPGAATSEPSGSLYALSGWDPASLAALLAHLGHAVADLADVEIFAAVNDAFGLAATMGIGGQALIAATTNDPTADTVRGLDAALRARYDPAGWRDLVRPIHDEMRALQRDALVAYILHQMSLSPESAHIDSPEKLFEYFLMDVQMDPCMETSRVRHALSSVQLFVERCLMSLEPRVAASDIDAARWEWMKRYRVWEANRKVFLWPENWLEPELRDDQSAFFKEAMGQLLQGDITDDRAATILGDYLKQLEDVAKLEPCGLFYVPEDTTTGTGETAHVVARTPGLHRKYFYRRREFGAWTPWEQIKLDIEDNPAIPVVWNDRLLLFWLRILKGGPAKLQLPFATKGDLTSLKSSDISTDPPTLTFQGVLCWSEFYNGAWQPAKTSNVELPTEITAALANDFDRSQLRLGVQMEGDALRVYVNDGPQQTYSAMVQGQIHAVVLRASWPGSFLVYNTHSVPVRGDDPVRLGSIPFTSAARRRDFVGDTHGSLSFQYSDPGGSSIREDVLSPSIGFRLVMPKHPLPDPWDAPFFFDDSRHAFYVTTTEEQELVVTHQGFGYQVSIDALKQAQISSLVAHRFGQPTPTALLGSGPVKIGLGAIDAASTERLVQQSAYIQRAISAQGVVTFGDKKIGPSGSLAEAPAAG